MAENKKFWFVVGSQALYGEEALDQVKSNAQDIANELNNKADLPFEIELQPQLATSADVITQIMKEANYRDDILGVITWMHTFSPAKMWIRGTQLFEVYQQQYDFDYRNYSEDDFNASVIEQIKYEIAIKRFLDDGGYSAFTSNFEDLHGLKQLPGLAVQRLNEQGYGFAGEGDWKTAALDRLLKIAAQNEATGFMEDYTYDLRKDQAHILGSHMLEVDPTLAATKPKIVVNPLGIGDKNDPARLVFDGKAGDGVVVTMVDLGTHYKFIVNDITAKQLDEPAPHLPVARVLWEVQPSLTTGVKRWLEEGGGHHTVLSLALTKTQILMLLKMFNAEYTIID